MKRRRQSEMGSLDSLLDTMTNVVGILVIMLVVTQLGVRDAVNRISQNIDISPEDISDAESQLEQAVARRDSLTRDLASDEFVDYARLQLELASETIQVESLRDALLQQIEDAQKSIAEAITASQEEAEAARQRAEELNKQIEQLLAQLEEKESRLAELRALLAALPPAEAVPNEEIVLPDPRSAPEGAKSATVLCFNDRAIPVDIAGIQELAQRRVTFLIDRHHLNRGEEQGIDGEALAERFNDDPIRNAQFDITLAIHGNRYPKLVLNPKPSAGDTFDQVRRGGSNYRRLVGQLDREKFYLQFLVWPDSYQVYVEARTQASSMDMAAGWLPQREGSNYLIPLGGNLRVGPPPAPRPRPEPNPNPQPPRPHPVDVID